MFTLPNKNRRFKTEYRKDKTMRKENKTANDRISGSAVQSYHAGAWDESYAFVGFDGVNKYFTSDRFIKLDSNYQRIDGKACKGFGIEFELESWGFNNQTAFATVLKQMIFKIFPDGLFKMQNDSTLSGGSCSGIECITQVMTKEFIRNNYKNFKTMFNDYFPIFDISAVRSGHCGMHVNISNACFNGDDNIRKFYYLINRHYEFMCALLNRSLSRTTWCGRMDYSNAREMDLNHMSSSHGNCFNGSHYRTGRIELRLVGGQKDFGCFRNTMESIFFMIEKVKTLKWDELDNLATVFSGCNQYVFDRIKTKCYDAGTISTADIETIRQNVVPMDLI